MSKKVVHRIFHSKLLLFGEHIINKGARGLAVPLEKYDAVLKFGELRDKTIRLSNASIQSLANYIIYNAELAPLYDTNQLLADLEKGLYFDSNIPQGYGVGSSGALVAAIYQQYRINKKRNFAITRLKNELALLESHYHGKSSGLDAIVCYLHKAVLVDKGEVSETFDLPKCEREVIKIFLIDTHIERKTAPYVEAFLEKCKEKKFMTSIEKSLVPATNMAIDAFLNNKYAELWKTVKIISQLHVDLLPEFIPKKFHDAWQRGLKTDQYLLKICGAGGGGFIIGFAKGDADLHLLLGATDVVEVMAI